jgi:hypothetical protein
MPNGALSVNSSPTASVLAISTQLHRNEGHPDTPLLEHAQELIAKLNALGVSPSELDSEADEGAWEDDDASTDNETDGDVDML